MEAAMNYMGLSGGAIALTTTIILLLRRLFRSRCVRGNDGAMAIQISLSQDDVNTIRESKELHDLYNSLKQEIQRQKDTRTPAAVVPV